MNEQTPRETRSISELSKYFVITKPKNRNDLIKEIYELYDKKLHNRVFAIKLNMSLTGSKDPLRDLHYILSVGKDMQNRKQNFSAWITSFFK